MKTAKEMNVIATAENRKNRNTRQNLALAYVDETLSAIINDEAAKGKFSVKIKKPECGELKIVKVYLRSKDYKVISLGGIWVIMW